MLCVLSLCAYVAAASQVFIVPAAYHIYAYDNNRDSTWLDTQGLAGE